MAKKLIAFILVLIVISTPVEASAKTYTTKNEVYNIIKKNIMAHKTQFTIVMDTDVLNAIGRNTDLFSKVAVLDDKKTPKDNDYLKLSVSSWRSGWRWTSSGDTATLTFSAVYRTTLTQEKQLDTKIKSILTSLKPEDKTDYQKVKAIHDYIIKKTSYDQTLEKHSAYNALIDNAAVCDGYSLAAYRLFTQAGLSSRIVTGKANGGSHSWNIVKVDGKWYNIDLTWDDPITNTGESMLTYDYFLKSSSDFSDHVRDSQYKASAFVKKFPIAEESYEME
ncbi:MAG: transglutaminase domain-containing protein [Anaerocolumna sp.]